MEARDMVSDSIAWSDQQRLTNRGVIIGLEQYYEYMKRNHPSRRTDLKELREYIDQVRKDVNR